MHIVETLSASYAKKIEPFMKTPISWSKVVLVLEQEKSFIFHHVENITGLFYLYFCRSITINQRFSHF